MSKSKFLVSLVFALCLILSMSICAFAAEITVDTTTVNNYKVEIEGTTYIVIPADDNTYIISAGVTVDKNEGTITTNKGTITTNNGTIKENRGTVTNNAAGGTISTNIKTVEANEGNINRLEKFSVVKNNSGYIYYAMTGSAVETNTGEIESTSGTVTTNNGTIDDCGLSSVITTNNGTIGYVGSNATVTTNAAGSTISTNYGTVTTNEGTVTNNMGAVSDNNGTVSHNCGGSVGGDKPAKNYFTLSSNLSKAEFKNLLTASNSDTSIFLFNFYGSFILDGSALSVTIPKGYELSIDGVRALADDSGMVTITSVSGNLHYEFIPVPVAAASSVPHTADNSNMPLWSALFIGFAAVVLMTKKKKA